MKPYKGGQMGRGLGVADHRQAKRRGYDAKRRADNPARAWYKSPLWRRKRENQLKAEPHCRMHKVERDELKIATVVDHVKPHNGEWLAFWHGELQSLCSPCHDRRKQSDERAGFSSAVGPDGWPTDQAHPANAGPRGGDHV